jgi:[protein-PII] uridylyltransferase
VPTVVPPPLEAARTDTTLQGPAFCRALSAATDRWLAGLFTAALDGGDARGLALVAVGGYGRAELCPGSDVDVVLLDAAKRDRRLLARTAERIWYPVWDAGVKLGHAVRTPKEALNLAAGDLDTATSMLSARLVAGDADVAADVTRRALAQWRSRSSRWLAALAASVAERHRKAGEVAFLLEPDLKEGRGGLRDVHALAWAEAADRILLPDDHQALTAAYEALLAARVELHRRTGRPHDRLLLQDQDVVADALGDADADALMARLAAAARTIAWTSDETWRRIDASLRGPVGRLARRDQPVGAGLVLRDGAVELGPQARPADDPTLALRAAAAAATAGAPLSRTTLDRLAASPAPMPDPWPEEARRALLRLLGAGDAAVGVMEALDQRGLLVAMVPEWAKVRNRPQRNAYHRFTVDRHLLEAAARAAALADRVHRPDLLLIAALLHDIGKGYPGDHSAGGAPVVEGITTRMGFEPADVAVLVTLTRHHLLLADAATRRDVNDPATADMVAAAVEAQGTLELLHALTEADSLATGPSAWSPWKAGLVAALVERVAKALGGQAPASPAADFPGPEHQAVADRARAAGEVVVTASGRTVVVAAPDQPGLFCRVAGTLALHGLDVLMARAGSVPGGVAVEELRVEPVFGGEPDWPAVERDLRRALGGRLSLEARIADRARAYGAARATAAVPAATRVIIDNEASATATVVEVRAPDRIGLLYRVTRALAELALDIRHATVASLGHEVVDAFYVVDASGDKIIDADHRREIERAVFAELSRA